MAKKAKVGVLGASGYTGSECVRLLLRHPQVEIVLLTAERRAGQEMREVFPQFSPFELPKPRLCGAPARDHTESDQGAAGAGAGHQGRRPVG